MTRKNKRFLGWIGFVAMVYWLWADYQRNWKAAIVSGWISIAATFAHILAGR